MMLAQFLAGEVALPERKPRFRLTSVVVLCCSSYGAADLQTNVCEIGEPLDVQDIYHLSVAKL